MVSLVTFDFLKLAIDTIFGGKAVLSASETGGATLKFTNEEKLNGVFEYDETNKTCTWKTSGNPVYSEEPNANSTATVSCINIGAYNGSAFNSYYSLPLGQSVTVSNGSQIKVNPYTENNGVHTRGIKVVFKTANTNEEA